MPAIQSTFCGYYGVEMKQHNLSCIHYAAFVRLDNNKKNKSCGIYATAREAAIARDKGLLCWHGLHPSSADKKSQKVSVLEGVFEKLEKNVKMCKVIFIFYFSSNNSLVSLQIQGA